MSLFTELKRRNVFRVAAAYAVVGWLIIQVGDVAADNLGFPDWFMPMLFVLLGLGFPLALFLAWAFEMTPDGVQKTADADHAAAEASDAPRGPVRGLNLLIVLGLVAIIAVLAVERVWFARSIEAPPHTPAQNEPLQQTSVAVLPFVNMSSNTEQEYFSDGITEEIINTLVTRTNLSIAARTSVFAFKGDNRNVSEIGRSLGVTHVIEGSVRSAGSQVRITAQLIAVEDGFHLWSDSYDRELTNIFSLQEEIASNVAQALSQALVGEGSGPARATTDPVTYDLYLQARSLLRQRGDGPLERAAGLLAEALERDPGFTPAWATAAQVADANDRDDDAIALAERALALDPQNVDALNALGAAYRDTFRWTEAESTFLRALELDPESSELLEDYAEFLGATGRTGEMLEIARRGWLIDPYLPPLAAVYSEALSSAGRADEALRVIEEFRRVAGTPDWVEGYRFAVLSEVADNDRLIQLVEQLPEPSTALRNKILAALRDPDDEAAVHALVEAFVGSDPLAFTTDIMISVYTLLYLGQPEPVLNHQFRQSRERMPYDFEWVHAPLFDGMRTLPGFVDLLEIIQLPPYWDDRGWPGYCNRLPDGTIECR